MGEYRYCKGEHDGRSVRFVLDDSTLIDWASEAMIAAVNCPPAQPFFGIPVWVVLSLGIGAPIALLGLRRTYRTMKLTP